jgi:hypothetical protein
MAKLSTEAFDFYVGLGPGRSYTSVAAHFGCSKRAVTKRAGSEHWQDRLNDLERQARQRSDTKIVETLEAMNARHLKTMQVIQARALEALRALPLTDAMDAVRALDVAVRQERTIRGEPADRTAVAVEDVVRREYSRWLTSPDPASNTGEEGATPDGDPATG